MIDFINLLYDRKIHEPEPCGYLPGRMRRDMRLSYKDTIEPRDRIHLSEMQFDSGMSYDGGVTMFKKVCDDCNACIAIRYPVDDFKPSDTQRHIQRLLPLPNVDTFPNFRSKAHLREHWAIYNRYRNARFANDPVKLSPLRRLMAPIVTQKYTGAPITIMEVRTIDYVLLGAAINAATENSYFAIFYYYDPAMMHLQPGKQIMMLLLEEARKRGKSHVYVGPWNAESNALSVKTQYRPYELYIGSKWQRFDTPHPKLGKLTP